jgi:hypothetical protein
MKIIIRAKPEIVIDFDSIKEKEITATTHVITGKVKTEPKPEARLGSTRGRKKKTGSCSVCGEAGHRKPTCPKNKKDKEQDNPFDNDLADKIEVMKDEGFSAQYIVDDLRLPLETVKRYY